MTLQFSLLILYHFDLFVWLFVCLPRWSMNSRIYVLVVLSFLLVIFYLFHELYWNCRCRCRRHIILIPCPPYHGFCFLRSISTYWFFDTDEKIVQTMHCIHTHELGTLVRDLRIVHRSSNSWLLLWVAPFNDVNDDFLCVEYVYAVNIVCTRFTRSQYIHWYTHSFTVSLSFNSCVVRLLAGSLIRSSLCVQSKLLFFTMLSWRLLHFASLYTFKCVWERVCVCLVESLCFVLSCRWYSCYCCYFGWFLFSLFEFSHFISFFA